jgi:hypothetical protein
MVVDADCELDPTVAKFQEQLAALKRKFGGFDDTGIFSPDKLETSKMAAMKLPLMPGAEPHAIRPYAKRFTPPMKEEIRAQVNKMPAYRICQRGNGNTVVSHVHLAPKSEKAQIIPSAGAQPSGRGGGGGGSGGPLRQACPQNPGRALHFCREPAFLNRQHRVTGWRPGSWLGPGPHRG